jgi:hypothetical protein
MFPEVFGLAEHLGLWVLLFDGYPNDRGGDAVPSWVWGRIDGLPERLYDRKLYLKGRRYRYRVEGRMEGQAIVRYRISRRLRLRYRRGDLK